MASLAPVSGTLGSARAAHLLRRASFGYNKASRQQFAGLTAQAAVDQLFLPATPVTPPLDPLSSPLRTWIGLTPVSDQNDLQPVLLHWWLAQLKNSGTRITDRMTYYLHTHFPTIMERVPDSDCLYYQLSLFRYYATDNFKALTRALCIDNAMLAHLDGRYNVASAPQENFAREFFELFTVGKGAQVSADNYTTFSEQDVKSATLVFTGWDTDFSYVNIDPVTQLPTGKVKGNGTNASQHAAGAKTFDTAFGNTVIGPSPNTVQGVNDELTAFIDMVFAQDHAAEYIVRRLYRFFVYYSVSDEVENDIIRPLAQQFKTSGYQLMPVLKTLLMSQHFYDEDDGVMQNDVRGALIKSPLELLLNALTLFDIPLASETTNNAVFHQGLGQIYLALGRQGMDLFQPYDVAGYDAYHQFPMYNRSWITTNYLAERYKFFDDLLTGGIAGLSFDFVAWVKLNISDPSEPDVLIDELLDLVFPVLSDPARRNFFRDDVLLDNLSVANWQTEWSIYTLTGNDNGVRLQLERLFLALTQSPEFQIH